MKNSADNLSKNFIEASLFGIRLLRLGSFFRIKGWIYLFSIIKCLKLKVMEGRALLYL